MLQMEMKNIYTLFVSSEHNVYLPAKANSDFT